MRSAGSLAVVEHAPTTGEAAPFLTRERLLVPLALLAVYVFWGATYLAIRFAVQTFPPFTAGGIRFLLAGSILYAVLRARHAPAPTTREWGGAAIVGGLLLLGGNGLVSVAETSVDSSLAAVLVATVPLWAALFAGLWGRWPSRIETLGLTIGFAGVLLLNAGTSLHAHPLGAVLLLIASACWAFGAVWSRYLPMPPSPMAGAAQMVTGGVLLLITGLAAGERVHHLPSARSAVALIYLVVFGSLIGFVAYSFLLQRVRPALATSNAYVNPVIAVWLGILLAGERLTVTGVIALFLVLTAVALVVLGRKRQ